MTEHFSNESFSTKLDKLLSNEDDIPAKVVAQPLCACGCDQPAPPGRKFVNQQHYDRSKGLSGDKVKQLRARFHEGIPKRQLAREYGIALSTVKRLLSKEA